MPSPMMTSLPMPPVSWSLPLPPISQLALASPRMVSLLWLAMTPSMPTQAGKGVVRSMAAAGFCWVEKSIDTPWGE
ncbi:hypothetical protein D3C85_1690850 [compost metagenome]